MSELPAPSWTELRRAAGSATNARRFFRAGYRVPNGRRFLSETHQEVPRADPYLQRMNSAFQLGDEACLLYLPAGSFTGAGGTPTGLAQRSRPAPALTHGDVVIIPAVGLPRDTTNLSVITRDMHAPARACVRLPSRLLIPPRSFAGSLCLPMLGSPQSSMPTHRRERTARGRADAKAKGVEFGRKPALPHQQREARERSTPARHESQRCPAATTSVKARISRLALLRLDWRWLIG